MEGACAALRPPNRVATQTPTAKCPGSWAGSSTPSTGPTTRPRARTPASGCVQQPGLPARLGELEQLRRQSVVFVGIRAGVVTDVCQVVTDPPDVSYKPGATPTADSDASRPGARARPTSTRKPARTRCRSTPSTPGGIQTGNCAGEEPACSRQTAGRGRAQTRVAPRPPRERRHRSGGRSARTPVAAWEGRTLVGSTARRIVGMVQAGGSGR